MKSVYFSVIFSGFIFGLTHFFNYFHGQSFGSTVCQVVGTTMLGTLLGAIYFKHRSFYGVAFLHALLDFATIRSQILFLIVTFLILTPPTIKKILKLNEKV